MSRNVESPGSAWTRAAPAPRSPRRDLRTVLRAVRRWWVEDRHYRPERRYMRG